jgi:hypothetical protein
LKGDQTKKNEMGGTCGAFEGEERFWWGNLRGKIPLGRCRPRWQDNIRKDLKSVGTEWTELIWLTRGTSGGLL